MISWHGIRCHANGCFTLVVCFVGMSGGFLALGAGASHTLLILVQLDDGRCAERNFAAWFALCFCIHRKICCIISQLRHVILITRNLAKLSCVHVHSHCCICYFSASSDLFLLVLVRPHLRGVLRGAPLQLVDRVTARPPGELSTPYRSAGKFLVALSVFLDVVMQLRSRPACGIFVYV